jgi:hypothetical protein
MTNLDLNNFCTTATDDPYWNESAWFSFSAVERELHGMVYYFFRPNMRMLMGGPIIWDNSGRHTWDCLYHDWHHIQPIPDGAKKFDFTSHTSLNIETVEPLSQYRLRYDCNGCTVDLDWTAIEPPHHFLGMEIEATGASPENRMHFEQMGRAKGTVILRGETIAIDSYALRDSSWGRRQIDSVRRGSYFWGIADEQTAFHAQTQGEDADQRVVGGFLKLDGRTSTIVGGQRFDTVMGEVTPASFTVLLEDEAGRSAEVSCRVTSDLMFNGFPRNQVVWSLLEVDFGNGRTGWGDIQEFQPMEQFRAMVRDG